jgi:glutamate carboxypeptidase
VTSHLVPVGVDLDPASFARAVELLESLAAVSSASSDAAGLRRFAARLAGELAARGASPLVEEVPAAEGTLPWLVARGGGTGPPILLVGHFDTVLDAASPRREGDLLNATGAIDMKGGIAAFLAALDLLRHRGAGAPAWELRLVPDEEVAGAVSHRAVATLPRDARALWVLEPGERTPGGGETIVAGRRGLRMLRLRAKGRSAHSGLAFRSGRSAILALADWALAAEAHSGRPAGPTVNVARLVGGDASFVGELAARAALVGTEVQLNVVPDAALLEGEVRYLTATEGDETLARLRDEAARIAGRREVAIDFEASPPIPPVEPTAARREAAAVAVAAAARRGWELAVETDRGGISFPNFLPEGAALPVLDGLGPVGGGMHTRDEHVELRSLARRIVLLADLLEQAARPG